MPLKQIMSLLDDWAELGKTGQVEINFREGRIRNYTVRESFLVQETASRKKRIVRPAAERIK